MPGVSNPGGLELYQEPAGAVAVTFPRYIAATSIALTNGTIACNSIAIPAGTLVSNITLYTNTVAKTGGTHGWYVLMTTGMQVLAVTADQTDPATVWGAAGAPYTLPVTSPVTITAAGLYYVGVMVAETAGTMPTFTGFTSAAGGVSGTTPTEAGISSSGQTPPPIVGQVMSAIGSNGGLKFYAYLS